MFGQQTYISITRFRLKESNRSELHTSLISGSALFGVSIAGKWWSHNCVKFYLSTSQTFLSNPEIKSGVLRDKLRRGVICLFNLLSSCTLIKVSLISPERKWLPALLKELYQAKPIKCNTENILQNSLCTYWESKKLILLQNCGLKHIWII